MNPYALLKRLGFWRALDAELVHEDGTRYAFKVKPEDIAEEIIQSQFDAVVRYRIWSTSDAAVEPGEGDFLEVKDADGNTSRHEIARSPRTTNYWEWLFLRNGNRKIFYTRY